jgi:hypothetical protein
VTYFNSTDIIILDTLEVCRVPEVGCAAAEDLEDSPSAWPRCWLGGDGCMSVPARPLRRGAPSRPAGPRAATMVQR